MPSQGKSERTRYDKYSLILSGIALMVSILSPFVTFYWLGPTREALRYIGVLQATYQYDTGRVVTNINNVGFQPVRNVRVCLKTPSAEEGLLGKGDVEVWPPTPVEVKPIPGGMCIDTGLNLGRGEKMEVAVPVSFSAQSQMWDELRVYASSEVGSTEASDATQPIPYVTEAIPSELTGVVYLPLVVPHVKTP